MGIGWAVGSGLQCLCLLVVGMVVVGWSVLVVVGYCCGISCGWLWLVAVGWLVVVGSGRGWVLVVVGCGWLWRAVGHGRVWLVVVGRGWLWLGVGCHKQLEGQKRGDTPNTGLLRCLLSVAHEIMASLKPGYVCTSGKRTADKCFT